MLIIISFLKFSPVFAAISASYENIDIGYAYRIPTIVMSDKFRFMTMS